MSHLLAATNTGSPSDFTSHQGLMLGVVALIIVCAAAFLFRRRQ